MTVHLARLEAYPDLLALVDELLSQVRAILGRHFVGMYLEGSLANDAFDPASDIDFVVVSDEQISGAQFAALQMMHDRLAATDSPWAIQLEGSYISRGALRRYDAADAVYPNIERGTGERLKLVHHDAAWLVHLVLLRERGITLAGPAPDTLIDPVAPDELRRAMCSVLPGWAAPLLEAPHRVRFRGYQSYIVLTLCRVLYTLQHGTVASKRAAAHWAEANLDQRWAPLVERAWAGRQNPDLEATAEDVSATVDFIRYALERSDSIV